MRPALVDRQVVTSGSMSGAAFGISKKSEAHILGMLRDRIYTNKVLAVLREYATNAWDEHRDAENTGEERFAGRSQTPILVNIPTEIEPTLYIRDYGRGLSEESVYQVYTQYGESTKRDSNDVAGMLGIGSKSAFAYSDSFTITSYHGGKKMVFVAVLDASNIGYINKLHEEPYDGTDTGIEVRVPVRPSDVYRFQQEAQNLFPYFSPLPIINMELKVEERDEMVAGFFRAWEPGTPRWVGIMGPVPYKIELASLEKELEALDLKGMANMAGGLYFKMGSVDVSANREELEYTERTRAAIVASLQSLHAEATAALDAMMDENGQTDMFRRSRIMAFLQKSGLPCPTRYKSYLSKHININPQPRNFRFLDSRPLEGRRTSRVMFRLPVADDLQLFVRDGTEPVQRRLPWDKSCILIVPISPKPELPPGLTPAQIAVKQAELEDEDEDGDTYDYIDGRRVPHGRKYTRYAAPGKKQMATLDAIMAELEEFLVTHKLTGAKITKLSEMPYIPVSATGPNIKHKQRFFKFAPHRNNQTGSRAWDVVSRVPEADDVFVILDRFEPQGVSLYHNYEDDLGLLQMAGIAMPEIYGYKTTEKSPVSETDVVGIPYSKWLRGVLLEALKTNPQLVEDLDTWEWSQSNESVKRMGRTSKASYEKALFVLGKAHPAVRYLTTERDARDAVAKWKRGTKGTRNDKDDLLERLSTLVGRTMPHKEMLEQIYKDYPLLGESAGGPGLAILIDSILKVEPWFDYIKHTDERRTAHDRAVLPADEREPDGSGRPEPPVDQEGGSELPPSGADGASGEVGGDPAPDGEGGSPAAADAG